ncbi:MAG: Ig-like domain-containing protein [Clostridiales bacterium]|nr:Ig-like domain-containing protein [Clostridiales bacterium]
MANDSKNGTPLDPSQSGSARSTSANRSSFSLDDTIDLSFTGSTGKSAPVDDAVVDDILRSISEMSDTPVPDAVRTASPSAASQTQPTSSPTTRFTQTASGQKTVGENEYQAAARHQGGQEATANTAEGVQGVDPAYYAMRDPAQTQSFQPARPTHRDTDRIPTLVEEKPVRKKTALGRVLTFIVVILVIVALFLGVRMLYVIGPSMGLDLPDLTQLPVISSLIDMLPSDEEDSALATEETDSTEEETETVTPTALTLNYDAIILAEGESVVITATPDVDGWEGSITWGTSDQEGAIFSITQLSATTAEIAYVGEGRGAVSAVAGDVVVTCQVTCEAADAEEDDLDVTSETEAETDGAEADTTEEDTAEAEHIDIVLNKDDFTLNVGESYQLMDENADQVTWTSSNTSVATVSDSGVVTAVSSGSATITATGPDGTTASSIARVR